MKFNPECVFGGTSTALEGIFHVAWTWGPCYHFCCCCTLLLTCFSQESSPSSASETFNTAPNMSVIQTLLPWTFHNQHQMWGPKSKAHKPALWRHPLNNHHLPHACKSPLSCSPSLSLLPSFLSPSPLFWCALMPQHQLLSPTLFSFKSILAILSPLHFYINFRISL